MRITLSPAIAWRKNGGIRGDHRRRDVQGFPQQVHLEPAANPHGQQPLHAHRSVLGNQCVPDHLEKLQGQLTSNVNIQKRRLHLAMWGDYNRIRAIIAFPQTNDGTISC